MRYTAAAFFDLDGTLTENESCWTDAHEHFGTKEEGKKNFKDFLRGDFNYPELMGRDISLWLSKKGKIHVTEIEKISRNQKLMAGAKELCDYLRDKGYLLAIVSAGFAIAARKAARKLGIENIHANDFILDDDGFLTGKGVGAVNPSTKDLNVKIICKENGIEPKNCIAVGDAIWEKKMFEVVGTGFAFCPKENDGLREVAKHIIEERDLRKVIEILENGKT